MKKTILFLAAGIFLISQICFAAALDPSKILIPKDKGRVVDTYLSKDAKSPLIVYLQDIHMNYESQKAEAALLETLIRDYGFDLVLLEGKEAGTNADFKYLRTKNSQEARLRGAEDLLKEGTISAVNYLDITTNYDFVINGVEDLALYKKETEDHMAIFGNNEAMVKLVATLQNIASNLKLHIYTKEARDLDDKIAAYDKDEIGLVEYVKFIEGLAAANKIDIKTFPNAALFIESANLEGQINFPAVETERQTATDAVEKVLKDKAREGFLTKGLKFRTGEVSQGEFYTCLKDTAQAAKVDISAHKNLLAYTQYISTYEKIDTAVLFKELDTLVNNIKEGLIKTPEQKALSQIDKGLKIVSDFVNTKLIPDEYSYLQQNKAEFNFDNWLVFLKNNSAKFGLTNPVPDDLSILKTNLPLLERFYATAFDRDNAFIANMKTSMARLNKDKAVFVAGGFHTPNMKRLLKENGFSYLVVAPRIDVVKNYEGLYRERSKSDLEYLNRALSEGQAPSKANRAQLDAAGQRIGQNDLANRVDRYIAGLEPTAPTRADIDRLLADFGGAADDAARNTITGQIAGVVQGAGFMGKYSIKEGTAPALNRNTQGQLESVTLTVVHADTRAETTVTIGAREVPDRAALAQRAAGSLTGATEAVRTAVQNAITGFTGVLIELDANEQGIFGFEHPTAIAVSQAVGDIDLAWAHEGGHLARATGAVSREDLLGPNGVNAAVDATGRTFTEATANYQGNNEMLDHYALMAYAQAANPAMHNALTTRIQSTTFIYNGQRAVTEQLRGRQYTIVVPKSAGTTDNLMRLPIVQRMIEAGAIVEFVQATVSSEVTAAVRTARTAGRTALVVTDVGLSESIAAESPADLNGVPMLCVDNFNAVTTEGQRVQGTTDLIVSALTQMEVLSRRANPLTQPAAQSLRSILSQLRGEAVTIDDVGRLLPIQDDQNLANRLRLVAQIRLLPRATPLTPIQAQEIMAARMTALSA